MRIAPRFLALVRRSATLCALVVALAATAPAHVAFLFTVNGDGGQVVPPSGSSAVVTGQLVYDAQTYEIRFDLTVQGLLGAETEAAIHGYANAGANGAVIYTLPLGAHKTGAVLGSQDDLGRWLSNESYLLIKSSAFPAGEVRAQIVFPIQPAEELFCLGDGSGTPCPCGNESFPGTFSGCKHSLGYGGIMRSHNIWSYSIDTLKVHVLTLPTTTPVLFFHGTAKVNFGSGNPFGDGLRCVGGTVIRLATKTTQNGQAFYPDVGESAISARVGVPGPGYVSHFQGWYRNADPTYCSPSTYNLTNGTAVTWIP